MRTCFVVEDAGWTGAARACADAAALLAARGDEPCLVAPAGSETERVLRDAGLDVVGSGAAGGWMRAAWRLRRVIAARLAEVVVVHGERAHLAAAAATRLAGRGVVLRRVPAGDALILGRDGRLAMRLADAGFVFSHADDVRGMTPPKGALAATLVPPGVAPPSAVATPRPGSSPAAVGAIRPDAPRLAVFTGADRRHETLLVLRTFALLAPRLPRLRMVVVAPTAERDALRLDAAALGVADRVDVRNASASRDVLLAGASLAWVVATSDDAVYAMLDALAEGLWVLAERTPLSARFVEDGTNGTLRHRSGEAEWASVIAAAMGRSGAAEATRAAARAAAARWPRSAAADGWSLALERARDRVRWTA